MQNPGDSFWNHRDLYIMKALERLKIQRFQGFHGLDTSHLLLFPLSGSSVQVSISPSMEAGTNTDGHTENQ